MQLTMKRRVSVAFYDTVDQVLSVNTSSRGLWRGLPSLGLLFDAHDDISAPMIGYCENRLREIRLVLFGRQVEPTLQFCIEIFMQIDKELTQPLTTIDSH
jgi:hypothetical protein